MALTNAEKQELINAIKAESQSVDELPVVDSLDGINSLPAIRGEEVVTAPVSLLRKPAEDAAKTANAAATKATIAATTAETAAQSANEAADNAGQAALEAERAISDARSATEKASEVVAVHESTALAALKGATARFDSIIDNATVEHSSSIVSGGRIVYIRSAKVFAYALGGRYFNNAMVDGVLILDMYMNSTRSEVLKNKIYICGAMMYVWSDEDNDLVEFSGSGGGNTINVTEAYPLANGFYTLATAIIAVEENMRAKGRTITYEVSQGKWETKQFVGTDIDSWDAEASWEDFGGAGTIKTVTVNGAVQNPDATGNVNITINEVEVDETLDAGSTNPVQNSAVAGKFNEVDANTVFGMSAEVSDDESSVRLALTNKSGAEIAAVEIPAGSGGGSGDASTTKIVLNASVDNTIIKQGGNSKLSYTYDHQYSSGDDKGVTTGQKATIEVSMKYGSSTIYSNTIQDVSKGTYTLDLSKYLQVGTTDIYVLATTIDPGTGKTQTKQSYVSVKVVALSLTSSYNLANSIANGGYGVYDTVNIPYAVSGSGTKVITVYLDGVQYNTATVTRSGTTNGSFGISMTGLSFGRHTIQMVAEMEAATGLVLKSESIYIDIFKSGADVPLIGTKLRFADGRIFTDTHLTPTLEVGQYAQLSFEYVAYDPNTTPAKMDVYNGDVKSTTVSVARTSQTYKNRFTTQGTNEMMFKCGETEYLFHINVTESSVNIGETTYGMVLKLNAAGRSNDEENPAVWSSNGVQTTFEGVDWKSSGWTGESLILRNGAKAHIDYKPFATDAASTGCSIELEFKVSNVVDREGDVITCMSGPKGFQITAEKASMYTGSTKTVTDEDGNEVVTNVGVGMEFASEEWLKVAFVVGKRADGRLMELFIDGERSKADIYAEADNFLQDTPQGITIDSSFADVEVRVVRIYNEAISDDDELGNYIVDRPTAEEMADLADKNDVLDDEGLGIDIEKIRKKGKGVILIVRKGGLDEINAENNKDTNFLADVYIYPPWGGEIILKNVYVRIQGTSSTKYARKNYRIYFAKGVEPELWINGVKQDSLKMPVVPGDPAVKVANPKCDYSDSSMTHNTGLAKLFNDCFKEIGLFTPPQEINNTIRTAINGWPCDMFSAESIDEKPTYHGQYNFNNDKSGWAPVVGFEGVAGIDESKVISLEFLNNSQKLGLFQVDEDIESQFDREFENALEFNYPKDTVWSNPNTAKDEKEANSYQKEAIMRLWRWVRDCVPADADTVNFKDISSFKSEKFKNEASMYFNTRWMRTFYVFTDYNTCFDQRVKNMIWITFDGEVWYILFYDGDTAYLVRNDCFLAYKYDVDRETWDAEKSKYAFEGYASMFWCLILANFEAELKSDAAALREVMTPERVLQVLNEEQMGNWSARQYNKSGEWKYIIPMLEGVDVKGTLTKYPHIYALHGSRKHHRIHTIRNRYALLDAKYETGSYRSDNIDMYLARKATEAANTIVVTANEVYYFGYGTNNSPSIQPSQRAEKGEEVTLTFRDAFTVNDPIRVYGASRAKKLDMRGAANNLTGDVNLNKCTKLQYLDLSTTGGGASGWCAVLDQCRQLREVNLNGQKNARTGTLSSSELNFSNQTRLEVLNAGGTEVQSVVFAEGAPLREAVLPSTLTALRLEYLPKLDNSGLLVEGYDSVETFRFAECPNLDWENILARCANVKRIRITGVNMTGDETFLARYKHLGGIDANGNAVDTCALVGSYQLTAYLDDDVFAEYKARYPELNIMQPQYTMIERDENVSADDNVSNPDNHTGCAYGNDYVPSGHIKAILKQRFRCLAKVTTKPTTRNITIAGVETTASNKDGVMTYFPLHDENSNYYADAEKTTNCTPAMLDGSEGDVMMFEPHYWFKGINDYLNGKNYSCYSTNKAMPDVPEATVLTLQDITDAGDYKDKYKIMTGKGTLANSYAADSNYAVCRVEVSGFKRVRFPSVVGTNLMGSIFTDSEGNVLDNVVVSSLSVKFENGMYLIYDVPAGATELHFTVYRTAEFDKVVLSNSDRIEDMEPDWVEHEECFTAVFGSSIVGTKLRSCITGGSTAASMNWTDFHYYSQARGMQQIDYDMHRDIANLFFAKYGRRNSQAQCGYGQDTYARKTGGTAMLGMKDTVNPNNKTTYAWYEENGSYVQINNVNCLGYEDIYGHKYDMMDNVSVNDGSVDHKWKIDMPDGTSRKVKAKTGSDQFTTAVAHGKYMDIIPVGTLTGSETTYYCDKYYYTGSVSRVVYRGVSLANSLGGVSCANANYDASNSNAVIGSRLAFRGKIERAQSVEAYKAIAEVA